MLTAVLAGCAPTPPDPELTTAADDARSATQTARLGVRQDRDRLLLPTTASVVYQDMGEELTDAASRLELRTVATRVDAQYRKAALAATRIAIEGTHAAAQGETATAARDLRRALAMFARLGTG